MTTNDGTFMNKKGMLSDDALLGTLYNAGFTHPEQLAQAYAIARTESNGRPNAYNGNRGTGDNSYGMFQINMIDNLGTARDETFRRTVNGYTGYDSLKDPLVNARAAALMTKDYRSRNVAGTDWRPWQKDLTSARYAGALPSTESVQNYINNRKAVEKGMGTISRGNSFFESKRAASEGYQAPSTIAKNPYTGTYGTMGGLSNLKSAPSSSAGSYAGTGKDEHDSSIPSNPSGITSPIGSVGAIGSNAASLGGGSGGTGSHLF